MGLAASKVCKQIPQDDVQEASIASTPILASKVLKYKDLDPRSPSVHISRTPLQLLSAATLKLDELKASDLVATTDETPVKAKTILLGIDPRSPTTEFKRTPIILNVTESDAPERVRNKTLDRVRQSVITTPKSNSGKLGSKKMLPNIVPPKLLESSPVKLKPDTNARKSFIGLLETNIDFTETDLDAVIKLKNKAMETPLTLSEAVTPSHKQFINVIQKESIDPRSPTSEFLRTPIQIIKKIGDVDLNDEVDCESKSIEQSETAVELLDHSIIERCVQEMCESVHLRAELETRTTEVDQIITLAKIDSNSNHGNNNFENKIEEAEDETFKPEIPVGIKSAPITPPTHDDNLKSVIPPILKEIKSAPVTPPAGNVTANVRELDKKLTSLIYQDEDIVICPRKVKLKDYDSRSPLRNLNSIEPDKKKAQLKVNDKMKKSNYAVSRIPVFKEKGTKTDLQCENTPPRNMEKRKVKVRKSHWDNADTTLII